jgi:hypothetical protein
MQAKVVARSGSHEVVDLLQVLGVVELLHNFQGAPAGGLA